jgi:hypothetical protein
MAKEVMFTAVRRNTDETVILVYKCRVSQQQTDSQSVVNSIKAALTNWAKQTPEGREAWEHSACDFNFADLAAQSINGTLQVFLEKAGIFDIDVQQIVDLNEFSMDMVLMDADQIPE